MLRAYKVRKLHLTDHTKLPSVKIAKSTAPYYFKKAIHTARSQKIKLRVDSLITNTETAAFLIIRNDTLLYEKYLMGFNETSLLPSNSMAKSFTGTLVGIALQEGKIKSVHEPITNYLPELQKRDTRFKKITIQHLLDMRSGLDFNEGSYNLKDDAVRLGFRPHLEKHILKIKIKEAPGKFIYQSVNTQLLGLIIQRASGKPLQNYLEEKLWNPIGASYDATWNVDSRKRKQVIISAALNATTLDFAKLGRLYLYNGKLSNNQIIGQNWVQTISSADTLEKYEGYKHQWWNKRGTQAYRDSISKTVKLRVEKKRKKNQRKNPGYLVNYSTYSFNAYGFLDQIIYIDPDKKLIIVRLGSTWPQERTFIKDIYELGEQL